MAHVALHACTCTNISAVWVALLASIVCGCWYEMKIYLKSENLVDTKFKHAVINCYGLDLWWTTAIHNFYKGGWAEPCSVQGHDFSAHAHLQFQTISNCSSLGIWLTLPHINISVWPCMHFKVFLLITIVRRQDFYHKMAVGFLVES